jgi:hypothetical protein
LLNIRNPSTDPKSRKCALFSKKPPKSVQGGKKEEGSKVKDLVGNQG